MANGKFYLIFLLAFFVIISKSHAAHIIGGEAVYKCISSNTANQTTTFAVSFTLYRDVLGGGANFDLNAQFGVYRKSPGQGDWAFVEALTANPTNISLLSLNDPCVLVPPNIRVEKGVYHFNVTLPWDGNIYQITYQRCCRNNTISNIVNPAGTGAVYTIEMNPEAIRNCNNSPVFKQFPPIIICNNRPLQFDHGATDIEGDSIVYSFCTPLTSGGQEPGNECNSIVPAPFKCLPPYDLVQYNNPYGEQNPLAASPGMRVDQNTGLLSGTPNLTGQFVVGICMSEYRNGVLLTTTRRDFQFNVFDCAGITYERDMVLCERDTLFFQDTVITEPGTFTKQYVSSFGCDSIIVYNIEGAPSYQVEEEATICAGESFAWQGDSYNTSGEYIVQLTSSKGCDSIITLNLSVLPSSEGFLEFTLCDDEFLDINGQIIHEGGEYTQTLINQSGCDSILHIRVVKGFSYRDTMPVYLCISGPVEIEGTVYDSPGIFEVDLQSVTGCDSILVVRVFPCDQNIVYDFEACNALTPENSMNYSEFVPAYVRELSCGTVEASNVYREIPNENKHSCTEGFNQTIAMCVSSSLDCDPAQATQKPVTLTVIPNPVEGSTIRWNHLVYYHRSPDQFSWINGAQGLNNGPTKFRFTIYKNGQSIFINNAQFTGDDWGRHQINFTDFEELQNLKSEDTIRLEWLPYCAKGNSGTVSVWDMDDIALYFSCDDIQNRSVSGVVKGDHPMVMEAVITRKHGYTGVRRSMVNGSFLFENNDPLEAYAFEGDMFGDPVAGVSTFDLVLIQKHILGIQTFTSPFQYVAADINGDGKINTIDLVILRKLILGVNEEFPQGKSWRLIPEKFCKENQNPLSWQDEIILLPGYHPVYDLNFIPVKMGDVSGAPDWTEVNSDRVVKKN